MGPSKSQKTVRWESDRPFSSAFRPQLSAPESSVIDSVIDIDNDRLLIKPYASATLTNRIKYKYFFTLTVRIISRQTTNFMRS
jgi:hypothetical protein